MISIILILLLFICSIYFCYKYFTLKNGLKQYIDIGTGRYGFYRNNTNYKAYNSIVYIKEIDRFTNGYSKIIIDNIETISKDEYDSIEAIKRAKDNFLKLKLTNDIEWLESEDTIKKLRKEKLEKLEKI